MFIDRLLTGKPDLSNVEPGERMEPKQGEEDLFAQHEEPIAAAQMNELMRQDGRKRLSIGVKQRLRDEHGGPNQPEGNRAG
ncbi:MAG: hypothetical protein R2724_04590 [Bryobacterales bacterium]